MSELRKERRFALSLPVEIVRVGTKHVAVTGQTRNLGSDGALLAVEHPSLMAGVPVEYYVTLNSTPGQTPVRIRCRGKVTHRDELAGTVAFSLERYEFAREPVVARASA